MKTLFTIYFIGMLLAFIIFSKATDKFSPEYFDEKSKELCREHEDIEYIVAKLLIIKSIVTSIILWPRVLWWYCQGFCRAIAEGIKEAKEKTNKSNEETDL